MTAHCSLLIADYFIAHSGGKLTPLQVIKMVYIAHGYSLAIHGRPLVDESIEAWKYGPVVPSVYHRAKKYGGSQITRLLYFGIKTDGADSVKKMFDEYIPPEDMAVLEGVLEVYGEFTGSELINMTHGSDSPWKYYRPHISNLKIPDDAIKAHYVKVIEDDSITHR